MKTSIRDLGRIGFVSVSYPNNLRDAVAKTVESWKKFCDLPEGTKKSLPYSNNADGVGYELKDGIGNKADRKENFDVTTAGTEWLKINAAAIHGNAALNFIQDAASLVHILKPLILDFAKEVELEFDLPGFHDEIAEGDDAYFIRFIHYFGDRNLDEETATAHTDQSGFTLHLFESDPGLQALMADKQWIDMPVSHGKTVIIPAMQLQLRSQGKLTALCHRVIANKKTALHGRYSAVCFVQLKNTAKYNKEKFGRLQEKVPGFNYGLSPEEFAKLFKK